MPKISNGNGKSGICAVRAAPCRHSFFAVRTVPKQKEMLLAILSNGGGDFLGAVGKTVGGDDFEF